MPSGPTATPRLSASIIIIGAGFAGIGMAIRLKQEGIDDFIIVERASAVGGTWRDNKYPGAQCDVPSHVYCFSFEPRSNWSSNYAGADEIQAYIEGLVDKWGLHAHLRLGTSIEAADYDEARGHWRLASLRPDDASELLLCRVVVSGVGGLVEPSMPDIPGLDAFSGELVHTARWRDDLELEGKRVGIIGTGASATQVVPRVAEEVESLTVFQRTACWVLPKPNGAYSEGHKGMYGRFPRLLGLSRNAKFALTEMLGPFILLDSELLSSIPQRLSLRHLHASVPDAELRRKLRPNYQFGCKRVLFSGDYWSSFNRDNVELVDTDIERVTSTGVQTRDGRTHELDLLILATGFAVTLAAAPFAVRGRQGRSLDDAWAQGASAYKGVSVAGFPNWFMMMGPNTGPGHTSVLVYTEAQIAHALDAIKLVLEEGAKSVEVRHEVQARYNEGIQRRMPHTSWASGCNSWYLSEDGSNRSLFPGLAIEYVLRTRKLRVRDYFVERFGGRRR
jgi:cation diffusion facilitator CzcD-associated flavoprotein CzcO